MSKADIVTNALNWLSDNDIPIPSDLHLQLEEKGYLKNYQRATKQGESIEEANATYHDAITESLIGYFESNGKVTSYKSEFKRAMVEAFGIAFDSGWVDGGQELPADDEALEWLNARVSTEFGFIDELFEQAKALRKEDDVDYFAWINSKADSYVSTLASVHNAALLLAKKNQMLTWQYGDADHCTTCDSLNGQRHRASWYLARDYIPGKPGAAMECGGYRCKCALVDDNGETVTI